MSVPEDKYYKYLSGSLRAYRKVTYGQYDEETKYVVPITQDEADAIDTLYRENKKLKSQLNKLGDKNG